MAAPDVPWAELDDAPDRTVAQTRACLDFLVETQGAEPVLARVLHGTDPVGWFGGAMVRRFGLRILGSPLRGWTTAAMGFVLDPGVDRAAATEALGRFAFGELRCVHLEVADRACRDGDRPPTGFHVGHLPGWELDLQRDDDALLAAMKPNGRRDVRRALRNGIVVEEVDPTAPGDFVAEYYAQVAAAFAKRGRTPTYPPERVAALLRHLGPTGHLLVLRARTPDGEPAATGIFPGLPGGTAEFWMGASVRAHQHLLPNEALMWSALRAWRDRGAARMNFGGGGSYKAKYGGEPHRLPQFRRSRPAVLEHARAALLRARHLRP
ncbi:MAG: GNAT family N-acetyltransferase [Actinobacteria bacterium]|nr:GNAT family N-acetyltransferase [Actinomycetota bacterium]